MAYPERRGMNFKFILSIMIRIPARRLGDRGSILGRRNVQTRSRTQATSIERVSGTILPALKRQERKADYPHSSNTKVKNA
jgi:hypothetical protein